MTHSFYVHIIESPSPDDLFDGRTAGNTLRSFLDLATIPCRYNLVVDQPHFGCALTGGIVQAVGDLNLPPIIHINAHGNERGIQLTDQRQSEKLVEWSQFSAYLNQLRKYLNTGVGVCMSSCRGAFARQMAEVLNPADIPMAWLVGTTTKISYPDAALAFATFYRGLQRGDSDDRLIQSINYASGIDAFGLEYGHEIQQQYTSQSLQRLLEQMRKNPQPPPWPPPQR